MNNGKFKLTLKRQKNFVGCLVDFDVYIDNIKVGKIKNGEILVLEVDAGVHEISIHKKNPTKVTITGDTTADVVVFGSNNFGITNINGEGFIQNNGIEKNKKSTRTVLVLSILIPAISLIMFYITGYYLKIWVHGIIVGYAIVNIFGLKNFKQFEEYKSILIKNIISIIISIVSALVISFLVLM